MKRRDFLRNAGITVGSAAGATMLPTVVGAKPKYGSRLKGKKIIVVGAGIAGLTAAWRCRKDGADITIYEAEKRVGGRLSSDSITVDGQQHILDRGAQAYSSDNVRLHALVRELFLDDKVVNISPYSATVRDGTARRVRAGDTGSIFNAGLISRDNFHLLGHLNSVARSQVGHLDINQYADWSAVDKQDAEEYALDLYGEEITRYLFEPAMQGLCYQTLKGNSQALMMISGMAADKRPKGYSLSTGLGSVTTMMQRRMPVKTNHRVTALERDGEKVNVTVNGAVEQADFVFLAVPAPIAKTLWKGVDSVEQSLLDTDYSSTIGFSLVTDRRWQEEKGMEAVYGMSIPGIERDLVAAASFKSQKDPTAKFNGEVVSIALAGSEAEKRWDEDEGALSEKAIEELQSYLPGLKDSVIDIRTQRWKNAEPYSPVGRSYALARYRFKGVKEKRVMLVGDYMSTPTVEGAIESAEWAVQALPVG